MNMLESSLVVFGDSLLLAVLYRQQHDLAAVEVFEITYMIVYTFNNV